MPLRVPPWTWWAALALALATGYADLARGGITIGPVLLVVGYCILAPLAIWRGRRTPVHGSAGPTPPFLAAAITSAAVLALYVATLAPTTAFWDASEYIAAAYTVGIPHPPGNPLFVLLGRTFALLPVGPSVAVRINILAALCSAAAAGFWFLIAHRVLAQWLPRGWQRLTGAVAAVLIGATAFTVWNQSVVNEKVYTVSLLGIAWCSWLMVRWLDAPEAPLADRRLILAAYLTGLGFANQMSALLIAPAVIVAMVAVRPRALLRGRLVFACTVAFGVGISVFATQPIRAAFNPPINEGEPTACTQGQGFQLDCTLTGTTWERFKYNFNREQYGKPPLSVRQAPFSAQLGMWWLYFRWQWLRDPYGELPRLQQLLAACFLLLGVTGGVVHYRRDRRTFWYFGTLTLTLSVLLAFYMNFRYGASQAPELGQLVPREVRDRDYFFIWSFSAWGVWAGIGLARVWEALARVSRGRGEAQGAPALRGWLITSPVLTAALLPLLLNWSSASRAGQTQARDFALDLLNSVEPYAILVTGGDNDTFPLWYAQEVEGVRRDVLVVIHELLNTDWHLRQAIRRRVEPYDATQGPTVYRDLDGVPPSAPFARMSEEEADSLPIVQAIREPMVFRKGDLAAVIDPVNLPQDGQGTGYLSRADVAILRMLADSWPARPVYFARSAEQPARQLGLGPYLLTQGLARKLLPRQPEASRDTLPSSIGWFDRGRTALLWESVYRGPATLAGLDGWVDRPSVSIPYLYWATALELAEAQARTGDERGADALVQLATRIGRVARLEDLLDPSLP